MPLRSVESTQEFTRREGTSRENLLSNSFGPGMGVIYLDLMDRVTIAEPFAAQLQRQIEQRGDVLQLHRQYRQRDIVFSKAGCPGLRRHPFFAAIGRIDLRVCYSRDGSTEGCRDRASPRCARM